MGRSHSAGPAAARLKFAGPALARAHCSQPLWSVHPAKLRVQLLACSLDSAITSCNCDSLLFQHSALEQHPAPTAASNPPSERPRSRGSDTDPAHISHEPWTFSSRLSPRRWPRARRSPTPLATRSTSTPPSGRCATARDEYVPEHGHFSVGVFLGYSADFPYRRKTARTAASSRSTSLPTDLRCPSPRTP